MGTLRVDGELYRFMGEEISPMQALAPISYEEPWTGAYTFDASRGEWQAADFDDKAWKRGEAAFGTPEETNIHTPWLTKDIWVRRTVEIDPAELGNSTLFVKYSHDDTFQLYFNGREIVSTPYEWKKDRWVEISPELAATAADGKIVLAAHCNNRTGGALVDMGLYKRSNDAVVMDAAAEQLAVDVQATRTACGGVDLRLTFTAPLLLEDPELVSRPVNYISYEAKSNDGAEHDVQIYFEASPDWSRDSSGQKCTVESYDDSRFNYVKSGPQRRRPAHRLGLLPHGCRQDVEPRRGGRSRRDASRIRRPRHRREPQRGHADGSVRPNRQGGRQARRRIRDVGLRRHIFDTVLRRQRPPLLEP